jgi:hypothetical protein
VRRRGRRPRPLPGESGSIVSVRRASARLPRMGSAGPGRRCRGGFRLRNSSGVSRGTSRRSQEIAWIQ